MSVSTNNVRRRQAGPRHRPMVERGHILIVLRDSGGAVEHSETIDVVRPSDPARRHEQLVRAVVDRFPDAHVYRAITGAVGFTCRSSLITASYVDGQAKPVMPRGTGGWQSRRSVAPPGSDAAARAA